MAFLLRRGFSFSVRNPLGLSSRLSSEESALVDAASKFAATSLAPRVLSDYENETFDRSVMREFGEAGLLGANVVSDYTAGVGKVAYGLVAREIERVDSGYRSAMSVQSSLVMYPLSIFGSPEQIERYMPGLASGELVGAFGLTEPDAGSDPASMATKARLSGGDYVLSGSKTWITNSPLADVLIVWARDESDEGAVRGFLVDRAEAGDALQTPVIANKLSLRASTTGSIFLDEVRVPVSARLPLARGLSGPFACLTSARYGIAWGVLGAAEDCVERALAYTQERKQFGRPLSSTQLVQESLAHCVSEIACAAAACEVAGRSAEEREREGEGGGIPPEHVSLVKRQSTLVACQVARKCRDLLGGNGISGEYGIMRHLANLETVVTYEGTAWVHALILGRALTGQQAFK